MPVYELAPVDPANPYAARARVGEPTHVGAVLAIETKLQKVMSDVWSDVTYAVVWNPTTGTFDRVWVGSSEFGRERDAEVDATPEVVAAHEAWVAAREAERLAAEEARREAEAEARLRKVTRGCRATVARGRKVAKGTEGRVFWLGQGTYGWRAGIETDAGETVWTALNNLDRVLPPKPEGMSWREFEAHLAELHAAA